MKTTIRDLARETSLSIGTVSMALNDSSKIKEETKRKVFRAIRKLDYDPTGRLGLMKRLKTKTLGLVLPAAATTRAEFYNRAILAAQQETASRGDDCKIFTEEDIVSRLRGNAGLDGPVCDGLVLFSPLLDWDGYLPSFRKRDMPVVLVRRSTRVKGVTVISDDDTKGARLALAHLQSLGHRRIGYVGRNVYHGRTAPRREAFETFMRENGMDHAPVLDLLDKDETDLLTGLIAGPRTPTALLCGSDRTAALVMTALSRLGKRVPLDMAVVGYNDDPLAALYYPGITTVHVPVEKMTAAACRVLSEQVAGDEGGPVRLEFENRLVVRESCGARRSV